MLEIGERPWGKYFMLVDGPNYKLKRIEVNPRQKLSYQYHHKRQEQWTIIEGDATVVLDNKEIKLAYGESIFIPLGVKYRIMNLSEKLLVFIEFQTGTYFGEDDIVRLMMNVIEANSIFECKNKFFNYTFLI
jgi:mannose-6-phosphate isomerase